MYNCPFKTNLFLYTDLKRIIMVLGGNPQKKSDTELLDMSSENGGVCTKPADLPGGKDLAKGAVGAFIRGMAIVCGGVEGGRDCHGYGFELQEWFKLPFLMLKPREDAAGIVMANGSWLIFGGRLSEGTALSDSEILNRKAFSFGFPWPVKVWGHCVANINITHGFIVGGRNELSYIRSSYILTLSSNYWVWIGDMVYDRSGHICGITKGANGKQNVITAGGKDVLEVEIYSFDVMKWESGPPLPHEMDMAQSTETKNGLLIFGGFHLGRCPVNTRECFSSRYIYELKNQSHWSIKDFSMDIPRSHFISIRITSENLENLCSNSCPTCPGNFAFVHVFE